MEETDKLEEGYLCGSGQRSNRQFHRTLEKQEADVYDLFNAVLEWFNYNQLGYPCRIEPKPNSELVIQMLADDISYNFKVKEDENERT